FKDIENVVKQKILIEKLNKASLDQGIDAMMSHLLAYEDDSILNDDRKLLKIAREIAQRENLFSKGKTFNARVGKILTSLKDRATIERNKKQSKRIKKVSHAQTVKKYKDFGNTVNQVCSAMKVATENRVKVAYKKLAASTPGGRNYRTTNQEQQLKKDITSEYSQHTNQAFSKSIHFFAKNNKEVMPLLYSDEFKDIFPFSADFGNKCASGKIDVAIDIDAINLKNLGTAISETKDTILADLQKTDNALRANIENDKDDINEHVQEYLKYKPYLLSDFLNGKKFSPQDSEFYAKYVCKNTLEIYSSDEYWNTGTMVGGLVVGVAAGAITGGFGFGLGAAMMVGAGVSAAEGAYVYNHESQTADDIKNGAAVGAITLSINDEQFRKADEIASDHKLNGILGASFGAVGAVAAPLTHIAMPIVKSGFKSLKNTTKLKRTPGAKLDSKGLLGGKYKFDEIIDHPTTGAYANADNLADADLIAKQRIKTGKIESKSSRSFAHQDDIIEIDEAVKNQLEKLGMDDTARVGGIADSDMGKTKAYQELLTTPSAKSDFLLDTLSGKGPPKSKRAMKKLMKKMGMKGQTLLPSDLNADQIRSVLKDNQTLVNFLHELPGTSDALILLEKGVLSEDQFIKRMQANLFHNGPESGFWGDVFSKGHVPDSLNKSKNEFSKKFFKGTVFEGKTVDGLVTAKYPSPQSFEGFVHTFYDRMSQATRGGVNKLYDEVQSFKADRLTQMKEMLVDNPAMTLNQLKHFREDVIKSKNINPDQKNALLNMVDAGEDRIAQFQKNVANKFKFKEDGNKVEDISMSYTDHNNNISVNFVDNTHGAKKVTSKNGESPITNQYSNLEMKPSRSGLGNVLNETVERVLKEEEALVGDPVRGLTLDVMKTNTSRPKRFDGVREKAFATKNYFKTQRQRLANTFKTGGNSLKDGLNSIIKKGVNLFSSPSKLARARSKKLAKLPKVTRAELETDDSLKRIFRITSYMRKEGFLKPDESLSEATKMAIISAHKVGLKEGRKFTTLCKKKSKNCKAIHNFTPSDLEAKRLAMVGKDPKNPLLPVKVRAFAMRNGITGTQEIANLATKSGKRMGEITMEIIDNTKMRKELSSKIKANNKSIKHYEQFSSLNKTDQHILDLARSENVKHLELKQNMSDRINILNDEKTILKQTKANDLNDQVVAGFIGGADPANALKTAKESLRKIEEELKAPNVSRNVARSRIEVGLKENVQFDPRYANLTKEEANLIREAKIFDLKKQVEVLTEKKNQFEITKSNNIVNEQAANKVAKRKAKQIEKLKEYAQEFIEHKNAYLLKNQHEYFVALDISTRKADKVFDPIAKKMLTIPSGKNYSTWDKRVVELIQNATRKVKAYEDIIEARDMVKKDLKN
ncbi:MAG: hypothetical protein HON90_12735, partial [Halobacteriovoraceae bacterium]|nr:hypothetical protein [Halobacteriovoraceae bacterium]